MIAHLDNRAHRCYGSFCAFFLEVGFEENWVSGFLDFLVGSLGYGVEGTVQGLKTEVVQCSYDDHLMVSSFSSHHSNCVFNVSSLASEP